MLLEAREHGVFDAIDVPAGPLRVLLEEVIHKGRDVVAPLAPRRQLDGGVVQAV